MNCLQCGLKATPSEVYQNVQLYECKERHLTGIIKEETKDYGNWDIQQKVSNL